ncbi:serine-threonine protein kinase, putative [Entamoeba invadens IP1]|uniref:Serine-threonine protein kinase, putative n=1 Tax=Entamoeba invadens IP1 TaxID=370355 RepID=A0A0A1U7U0_ENTIV|nr:serine-threonine protein kinase, putative [Entamoeba invadens IP1]ELP89150.1 serine-threonine protein kinase, putative [Entamoeba invadens IP1]|eukprot:XP_004255921.1 serine-threonine protein kinase, putative [Entamoeba invadens IP1]
MLVKTDLLLILQFLVILSSSYPCTSSCVKCVSGECEECDSTKGFYPSCTSCLPKYYLSGIYCERVIETPLTCQTFLTEKPSYYVIHSLLTLTYPKETYFVNNPCASQLPLNSQNTKGYFFKIHTKNAIYTFSSTKSTHIVLQESCEKCLHSFYLGYTTFSLKLKEQDYVLFMYGTDSVLLTIKESSLDEISTDQTTRSMTETFENYYGDNACLNELVGGRWYKVNTNNSNFYTLSTGGPNSLIALQNANKECVDVASGATSAQVVLQILGTLYVFSTSPFSVQISCAYCSPGVCSTSKGQCVCEGNYVYRDGNCSLCGNGQIDSGEECENTTGCGSDCKCLPDYTSSDFKCYKVLCGNDRIDIGEECDGGQGCKDCKCLPNYRVKRGKGCEYRYTVLFIYLAVFVFVYVLLYTILFIVIYSKTKVMRMLFKVNDMSFVGSVVPFEKKGKVYVNLDMLHNYVSFNPKSIVFNDSTKRPEVDEVEFSKICITNCRKESMTFILHGREEYKYELVFDPYMGSLKGGQTITVRVKVLIRCTTIIKDKKIPVTLEWANWKNVRRSMDHEDLFVRQTEPTEDEGISSSSDDEIKVSHATQIYSYLLLNAESEVSTRLDYEEVHLEQPPVGAGTFGIVYRAKWRKVEIAVKVLKTDMVDLKDLMPNFEQEAQLMERLRCQNIVNFIGTIVTPDTLCIVTEFCNLGSLRRFIKLNKISTLMKVRFCQDIALGMGYLHQNDIVHHDLKTDNVLVYSKNPYDPVVCKVSDFGTSQAFIESSNTITIRDIGTPLYMAPEVHKTGKLTLKSDVFSFAICMLEIWLTRDPYPIIEFRDGDSVLNFVCSGKRVGIPRECVYRDIIKMCWHQKPEKRPVFSKIIEWLAPMVQELSAKKKEVKTQGKSPKTRTPLMSQSPKMKKKVCVNQTRTRRVYSGNKNNIENISDALVSPKSFDVNRSTSAKTDEENMKQGKGVTLDIKLPRKNVNIIEKTRLGGDSVTTPVTSTKSSEEPTRQTSLVNDAEYHKILLNDFSKEMHLDKSFVKKEEEEIESETMSSGEEDTPEETLKPFQTAEDDSVEKYESTEDVSEEHRQGGSNDWDRRDGQYFDYLDPHRLCKREVTLRRNVTMINFHQRIDYHANPKKNTFYKK